MLYDLRNDQWEVIKDNLPGKAGDRGRRSDNNRGFIKSVMWIARTGAPSLDEDNEWIMLDSTMIRAHQHAAGARENIELVWYAQELGRSKGGFTTKLHAACDGLNSIRFFITAGQRSDYIKALGLMEGKTMRALSG